MSRLRDPLSKGYYKNQDPASFAAFEAVLLKPACSVSFVDSNLRKA
jgi:hypothetical protein